MVQKVEELKNGGNKKMKDWTIEQRLNKLGNWITKYLLKEIG